MTPEELNRAIEFLVEQEARTAVRMEELTVRMDGLTVRMDDLRQTVKVVTENVNRLREVAEIQSRRLDRAEKADRDMQKWFEQTQKRNDEFHWEALRMLREILDRLTRNQNPNLN